MRELILLLLTSSSAKGVYHKNYNNNYDVPSAYDKSKCPNSTVLVDVGIFYLALVDMGKYTIRFLIYSVDLVRSSFTTKYILHLRWNDTRLAWAASQLEVTVVDAEKIWTPYLAQYTDLSTDPSKANEGYGRRLQVFSDGTVYWQLSTVTTGLCRITTRYFPYDKHRCGIVFSPEANQNVFFRRMFEKPVISAYSKENPSWKLKQTISWTWPYDYTNEYKVSETTVKVIEELGTYVDESIVQFGFEYERSSSLLANLWLFPLCIIIFSSNKIYLIVRC